MTRTLWLQTIDEQKGVACGVHGGRRHDRPGGGIPSVAQGMEARSDRCDVGAPGRSDGASQDRRAALPQMGNSECGIGNEVRLVLCREAAVVRSVERVGSSIDGGR